MLCALYCNYKYSCFFLKRKKVTIEPSLLCSLSAEKIKALCPGREHSQMAAPPSFPQRWASCHWPLAAGPTHVLEKTFFISSLGSASLTHVILAKGYFSVILHFGFCFRCFISWGTVTCCCRAGMLLLWSCQGGGSGSCFPSGGDRQAVTQGSAHLLSSETKACVCLRTEWKAFRKVAGGGPGFLHIFQTAPMNHAAHRHAVYYFHSDSGHPLFLHVIYVKPSFWLLGGPGVKCLTEFSPVSVFSGSFHGSTARTS